MIAVIKALDRSASGKYNEMVTTSSVDILISRFDIFFGRSGGQGQNIFYKRLASF